MLIYPRLAALLALGWGQNDSGIRRAAKYIRQEFEASDESLHYETYMHDRRQKGGLSSWRFIVVSHGGVFLVTQLMAMGIEFSKWPFKPLQWGLLAVDGAALMVRVWVMKNLRKSKAGLDMPEAKEERSQPPVKLKRWIVRFVGLSIEEDP